MLQVKIGIQLASLRQPFKKALQTAAQLGAQAVEIDARGEIRPRDLTRTGVRQVRKMLEDVNLRVSAIGFQTRRGYNVAEDLEQRVEATKQAMSMAHDLGAPVVVNQVGRIPNQAEGADWDLLIQSLSDLGQYSQRIGAMLAARTGTEDAEDLRRLIDALPDGAICVDLDPGNLIINGFSAREAAKALGQYVMHIHARDAVRDLAIGRGLEVPLGRGSVDFPELLGLLEEHSYRGILTIQREHSEDPVTEIGHAVEYLKSL